MNFIKNKNKYNFFDYSIYSCKIGMVKPNLDIFQFALEMIGEKAENVVFIDDKAENVNAAKKLGINGIVFKDHDSLKKDLKELGAV